MRDAQGRDGELKPDELYPVNPASQDGSRDNTELMYLQEPHMLHNLAHRYARDAIYTYTAHILIACNPFKRLPLYGEKQMRAYQGKSLGMMEPHVYAVADRAYRSMSHYKMSACIARCRLTSSCGRDGRRARAREVLSRRLARREPTDIEAG